MRLLLPLSVALALLAADAVAGPAAPAQGGPDPAGIEVDFEPVVNRVQADVVDITHAGDGSGRLFVVDKAGRILIVKDGQMLGAPFLDIRNRVDLSGSNEKGLLGLTFHPDYETNGRFFVYYSAPLREGAPEGWNHTSRLVELRVSDADPDRADQTEKLIRAIDQPQANHNGGALAFGPDGYLYVGLGDGGAGGDQGTGHTPGIGNGQDKNVLLGKLLRLDVDGGDPYAIPDTNPFKGASDAREEIWAYGLRNPWRIGFDRQTGDLYIADVGQGSWEEIDFQPAASPGGENYGWRVMEGSHCFRTQTCDQTGKVLPIAEYDHAAGKCSVTGGFVYRGSAFPGLAGAYFYGDYCSRQVWATSRDDAGNWRSAEVGRTGFSLQTFGEDEAGEIYAGGPNGLVHLVDANAGQATPTMPGATTPPTEAATSTATTEPATRTPEPTPSGRLVDIKASEYAFAPSEFTALPGEALTIRLENIGPARPHDIVFETEGSPHTDRIQPGQIDSVSFTAPTAPGRYAYFCSVGNHRAQGMEGQLVVAGDVGTPTPGACADCKIYLPVAQRGTP